MGAERVTRRQLFGRGITTLGYAMAYVGTRNGRQPYNNIRSCITESGNDSPETKTECFKANESEISSNAMAYYIGILVSSAPIWTRLTYALLRGQELESLNISRRSVIFRLGGPIAVALVTADYLKYSETGNPNPFT